MSIDRNAPLTNFLGPRYWLIWPGIGLLWCISKLPYRLQVAFGKLIGIVIFKLSRRRRHIAEVNLKLCFPKEDSASRKKILHQHFESLGMLLIEMGLSWLAPTSKLKKLVRIEGLEHLEQAQAKGKGVILLIAHFTTMEIGGQALGLYTPFHFMHRRNENPLLAAIMERGRKKAEEEMIAHDDVRTMLKTLKKGHAIWYAPDQNYGHKGCVMAPFFDIPAPTNPATARIAAISGAALVSYYTHRLPDGSGYRLTIMPALEHFPSGDIETDTIRINQLIEEQVRQQPEEYLWVHQRFKEKEGDKKIIYAEK